MDPAYQPDPWQTPPPEPQHAAFDVPVAPAEQPPEPVRKRSVRVALAWLLIAICTAAIMYMQSRASELPPPPPADASPGLDMVFFGRLAVGLEQVIGENDQRLLWRLDGHAAISPFSTTDHMRVAIVAAELQGSDEAFHRLTYLSDKYLVNRLEPASDFHTDHRLLQQIYSDEAYIPTNNEAQGLIARHGWFGELAAGYNLPAHDPLNQIPRDSAKQIVWMLFGFGGLFVLAFLAGCALLITAIILAAMGKLRAKFHPGALSHRSAYLEMVAIFLAAFIALQLLAAWLKPRVGFDLLLPMLVCMAVPVCWPRLCGISAVQFRKDMGLFTPKGIHREVFSGVLGYLAGLPIIFFGAVVTIVISELTGMDNQHPAGREIITGSTYQIVVLILAIVVWAPLVEELVFRAAFYRHLRQVPGWVTWLSATAITSFIFAAIHPQGILGVPVLMSIAFVLAGLRQWRGSLVAPITAHALHNGTIATLMLVLMYW